MTNVRTRDYEGRKELDPQCEELDLRPRISHWHCTGCGTRWPKSADSKACPGCGATLRELRAIGLLGSVEVPV